MITISNIRDAIAKAKYIDKKDRVDALAQIDNLKGEDFSEELSTTIQKLLQHEALKATEEAAKAEYQLQSSVAKAVNEMDEVVVSHTKALMKIETDYEGSLEKEVSNSDKNQVDQIRQKLGI